MAAALTSFRAAIRNNATRQVQLVPMAAVDVLSVFQELIRRFPDHAIVYVEEGAG